MKVAALGRTRWLRDGIERVAERGHEVVLVGTCPASPEYDVKEADLERLAARLRCPFFCDPNINAPARVEQLRASGAEVAISVNWLTLMGRAALGAFPRGVLNAHAGDLPRYRGNAAPNWAILAAERQVVVTVHEMATALDAGPILLQRQLPIDDRTYVADVYRFLDASIPELFAEAVDGLAAGTVRPRPQPDDPALSLRGFPRHPCDGELDWRRPADELARVVRASGAPFQGAYTHVGVERLTVWRARPDRLGYPYLGAPGQVAEVRRGPGEVLVLTGEGVLVLEELETRALGRGPAASLIPSTRTRLGLRTSDELERLAARVAALEQALGRGAPP